jgi:plasmid stability protein
VAQFLVRDFEDDVYQKLRNMPQRRGQSLEEFVREMLRKVALESAATPNNLGSKIAKPFAKIGLKGPIEELRSRPLTPPSFE